MKLSKAEREKIVHHLMTELQTLVNAYENGEECTGYVTMIREDGSKGFAAMLTFDRHRCAAMLMQMRIEEELNGFKTKADVFDVPKEPEPEQN